MVSEQDSCQPVKDNAKYSKRSKSVGKGKEETNIRKHHGGTNDQQIENIHGNDILNINGENRKGSRAYEGIETCE